MMIVIPPNTIHMHRDPRSLGERHEAMGQHFAAQVADLLALEAEVHDAEGAVGEVDDGAGEGFVEGAVGGAEAGEACGGGEGGFEGLGFRN